MTQHNQIAKHCWEADHNLNWDEKEGIDRESRLIFGNIKETIHSLKNPNHIKKNPYMFPETRLSSLQQFLVIFLYHIHRFYLMKLTETHQFCVHKALLSNFLNQSHCATFLISQFFCFRPYLHIFFLNNHLHCPLMREVSLKTQPR